MILEEVTLTGSAQGPLKGLTFFAKENIDLAGCVSGSGNPTWRATHNEAKRSAPVVEKLLAAGATCLGHTVMDELALDLVGVNKHYGTPLNTRAPNRVPGGSSSGSAAVVAASRSDFAIGTDTGGSVRVPASCCGLYGFRPTHGVIPLDGVVPLGPSYDTIGWMARDQETLKRVGETLLPPSAPIERLLLLEDAFDYVDSEIAQTLRPLLPAEPIRLFDEDLSVLKELYLHIQGFEAWACLGSWVSSHEPDFADHIRKGFAFVASVTPDQYGQACALRREVVSGLETLLEPGTALVVPTVAKLPPLLTDSVEAGLEFRFRTLALGCLAGSGGFPQITLPLAELHGCPIGLSLIGARHTDLALLNVNH